MSQQQILERIQQILRGQGVTAPLEGSTDLLTDLQLDSIQQLSVVVALENDFRVCFAPGDEAGLRTLADAADLVARRLDEQRAESA